ncbi:MAG: M23 family metallopeptidase [Variibacter sp.]|nr:M23 family metallopeptidase [Variibacter sp.]
MHSVRSFERSEFSRNRPAGGDGQAARPGYALVRGSRALRITPLALWSALAGVALMALWSAAAGAYFVFRDDLLTGLIARQADMQHVYEDRIAALRSQVDRLNSRQLLNQEQVEQRIEQLAQRQATLAARTTALSGSGTGRGAAASPPLAEPSPPPAPGTAKPSPLTDDEVPPQLGRQSERHMPDAALTTVADVRRLGALAVLGRLEQSLDQVEAQQRAALMALEDKYDARARRIRGVLAELGVDMKKLGSPAAGVGGPFVPVRPGGAAFDRQFDRVELARARANHLAHALATVPVGQPIAGEIETSSSFGVRLDPFLRAPAMHSGLDLRAGQGEPVRATAAGTVVSAGWNGGYGRMIEIDHGNGFSTRYGHLSQILVREDQAIQPGQLIGRVGSTGRSTGPHLHYETRIDGEAVDPVRFLQAGLRLRQKP